MKQLAFAFLLSIFPAVASAAQKQFEVELNATVDTAAILFAIAPNGGRRIKAAGLRPGMDAAVEQFSNASDHPSAQLVDRYLKNEAIGLDTLMALAVSSPTQAPQAVYVKERFGNPEVMGTLSDADAQALVQALNEFFIDADVAAFLSTIQSQRDCAIEEIRKNLPPAAFVPAMESFYGQGLARYVFVPSPIIHHTMGFGPNVLTERGKESFIIIGPTTVTWNEDEYKCGFDDPEWIEQVTVHEIQHTFVNPALSDADIREAIDFHADLLNPIKEEMRQQGYSLWFSVAIEHMVRLGEIRIMEAIGETDKAKALRDYHVFDRKFIYLPVLEETIKEYEMDRQTYPLYEDFTPRLIEALSDEKLSR